MLCFNIEGLNETKKSDESLLHSVVAAGYYYPLVLTMEQGYEWVEVLLLLQDGSDRRKETDALTHLLTI